MEGQIHSDGAEQRLHYVLEVVPVTGRTVQLVRMPIVFAKVAWR
jgi:hypothetical protein